MAINMQSRAKILGIASAILCSFMAGCAGDRNHQGNVIFIHPDGTSPAHWGAARMLFLGPDQRLNWD